MKVKDEDFIGRRFGRLTVIHRCEGDEKHKFLCKCDCGNYTKVTVGHLNGGNVISCGCYLKERYKHGLTHWVHGGHNTRLHGIWDTMRRRCESPSSHAYKDYGGRGIHVCDDWKHSFTSFRDWAYSNGYSDDLSIDRINNDLGYCPENCRWVTAKVQANNRRNTLFIEWHGETHSLSEWSEILNINKGTLYGRLHRWQSIEKAFSEPIKKYTKVI